MGTLATDHSPLYSKIWWLVHWPLHVVQRGGARAGCGPAQSPSLCSKCNSPPVNGQLHVIRCDTKLPLHSKGLSHRARTTYDADVRSIDVRRSCPVRLMSFRSGVSHLLPGLGPVQEAIVCLNHAIVYWCRRRTAASPAVRQPDLPRTTRLSGSSPPRADV